IKPANILVKGDTVLFTDFGIALHWEGSDPSTTQDTLPAMTRRYSAPELLDYAPRNRLTDIWSLGCVFLEMITVLNEKDVTDLSDFLENFGTKSNIYARNQDGIQTWMDQLKTNS